MNPPLLNNILEQSQALETVVAYQSGPGREALIRSSELIRSSGRVVITGMGASFFACHSFGYELEQAGLDVWMVETSELLYFQPKRFRPGTCVVVVSRSGESVEVTKLLPALKHHGCKTVGVTNILDSTLARQATTTIFLNSPHDQIVAVQSYTSTVTALAMLGAACTDNLDTFASEFAMFKPVLGGEIRQCLSDSESWGGLHDPTSPLYVLSRGRALGTVAEGVLLMHETAKVPAVGMSVPQFRHGPVEVMKPGFRCVVVGTQSETVALDATFAQDLTRLGGHVYWVGPGVPDGVPSLATWPKNIPQRLSPVLEVIPLQFLAYRTAERLGLRIGEFHFAPQVTLTESGFEVAVKQ